jgi:hypothetical protein
MRAYLAAAFAAASAATLCSTTLVAGLAPVQAQTCQFLAPVGGNGTTNIVLKTVGPGNPFGRPNWNTDFFAPQMGTGRMWGPFPAIPGKTVSQLNFKIGASADQAATGFTYRISTMGCN